MHKETKACKESDRGRDTWAFKEREVWGMGIACCKGPFVLTTREGAARKLSESHQWRSPQADKIMDGWSWVCVVSIQPLKALRA